VACTRARDHLLLSGSLASEHFAEHDLEAAPDCLFWLCRSLNITEADLYHVSKAVEGLEWPVRIYTYTESFPYCHLQKPTLHTRLPRAPAGTRTDR
jgi:hypothetical protein